MPVCSWLDWSSPVIATIDVSELNFSQEEKAQVVPTVKINKQHHLPLSKSKSNKKPTLNTQHFK